MRVRFRDSNEGDPNSPRQWYWTFYGDNGEPLAKDTESHPDRADAIHNFELVTASDVGSDGTARRRLPDGMVQRIKVEGL
jgi:hypothetical protein